MPEDDTGYDTDLWSALTTPGWCLAKCVTRNFTYAGVHGARCHCGNNSPTFARAPLSQCSWECEVDRNQTCGGPKHLSVVGPGYPSVPAYCAHEHTLEHRVGYTYRDRVGLCIEQCASSGNYRYAGYSYYKGCYCGAREPAREWVVDDSKCDAPPDPEHPDLGRGGSYVFSVYQLNTTADTEEDITTEGEEVEDVAPSPLPTSSDAPATASSIGKDQIIS